ncbi:TPA: hypothetical protein ACH3X3_012362 [Trebouxia sp. C0006]
MEHRLLRPASYQLAMDWKPLTQLLRRKQHLQTTAGMLSSSHCLCSWRPFFLSSATAGAVLTTANNLSADQRPSLATASSVTATAGITTSTRRFAFTRFAITATTLTGVLSADQAIPEQLQPSPGQRGRSGPSGSSPAAVKGHPTPKMGFSAQLTDMLDSLDLSGVSEEDSFPGLSFDAYDVSS